MRFHVVGLPHLPTSVEFSACAFTARCLKFCKMMTMLGHEVYHYGVEGSSVCCTSHYNAVSAKDREEFHGPIEPGSVSYSSKGFDWNPTTPHWRKFNGMVAAKLMQEARRGDFICLSGGSSHKPMIEMLQIFYHSIFNKFDLYVVEHCVGYMGSFAPFQVFESYAHMHQMYGRLGANDASGCNGRYYDAVIPGSYDDHEYLYNPKTTYQRDSYVMFVGRLDTPRKGIDVAIEAARRAGVKIVVCGQGASKTDGGFTVNDGGSFVGSHIDYEGYVNAENRSVLMAGARAILVPTSYIEPFGGVNVEAQLCGTPAITTDWGAFTETVEHGKTGYRCRTLEQWVWAIQNAGTLDRDYIHQRALRKYNMAKISRMYNEYFAMLSDINDMGWYQDKTRTQLDWLN